jgi:hypothetical protein
MAVPPRKKKNRRGASRKGRALVDSTALKKKELLFSIHRHWIWADRIRLEYYERLKANPPRSDDLLEWFLTGEAMYLCIWYGLLFTVCEGLRKNGFAVPDAQTEIDTIYNSLQLFRNAIFHIQTEYLTSKIFSFLQDASTDATIRKIYDGLDEWFRTQVAGTP